MAINFDLDRAGLINLSRNIDNNQMAFVPNFLKNIFTGDPEDIQLGEEGSPLDKAKDALEKNKQKSLPTPEEIEGKTSFLNLPSNNLTAMAISNYDDLFGPQILTDALGNIRTTSGFAKPNLNTLPFNVNEVSTDGITNNVRFRDMLLNDIRNLPSDIKTGLGESKNKFLEDISGLAQGLGSIKNKGMNLFGLAKDKGIDLGKMIGRGIGNAIFPGLGFLIGNIKESPTDKVGLASFGRGYDPYGLKGQLTSGTLGARQDPFGRNIVSMFSDYEQNRINELKELTQLKNLGLLNNKMKQNKLDFAQNYLEKVKQEREQRQREAARRNFANVYASADKQGFTGPGGGFDTSAADKAGTSLGSGQFSPSSSRGRSGY